MQVLNVFTPKVRPLFSGILGPPRGTGDDEQVMRKYNELVTSCLGILAEAIWNFLTPTGDLVLPNLYKGWVIGRFYLWSLNDIIGDMAEASVHARVETGKEALTFGV